ncbi:MAG: sulfotransferase [Blastocatellia bacterium]|nr:sulfotransferase [Blastocatellia bacterium]
MDEDTIIIVSGLPRSGTSMMMSMLVAGGLEVLTDDIRTADEDNPKGYYEFEKVKELAHDKSWIEDARGKVVKIISALLKHLPAEHAYKVIFMHRNMEEILASQRQMLIRREQPADTVSDERMAEMFRKHLKDIEAWLAGQQNFDVLYVNYNEVLRGPDEHIEKINRFLGNGLDVKSMAGVVDRALYRQKK